MGAYAGPERRRVAREGWRAGPLGTVQGRMRSLIVDEPTVATRFFLAFVAFIWTVCLALPGDSFERPTFAVMRRLTEAVIPVNAETAWLGVFATYGSATLFCVFRDCKFPRFGMLVNAVGAFIYTAITISVATIDNGPFPAGAAAHAGIACAALWVLLRTGINSPSGWRHD